MKSIKLALVTLILILPFNNLAFAISQNNITVGLTGTELDGNQIYVGITPNPNSCLNGGIYFNDQAELDKTLSVAIAAKLAGKTVRVDYTQPGGVGTECLGYSIYIE